MERREHLFTDIGKFNPPLKVVGMRRERAKEERKTLSFDRYYEMLKDRKEVLAKEEPPEEKRPRRLLPNYPVENWQSPVIQNRE